MFEDGEIIIGAVGLIISLIVLGLYYNSKNDICSTYYPKMNRTTCLMTEIRLTPEEK